MSILANTVLSVDFFDIKTTDAAPAERPEARKRGPSIEVFHKGRALNAENRIPVYIPNITEDISIVHATANLYLVKNASSS